MNRRRRLGLWGWLVRLLWGERCSDEYCDTLIVEGNCVADYCPRHCDVHCHCGARRLTDYQRDALREIRELE
jgi:hypothetical protein